MNIAKVLEQAIQEFKDIVEIKYCTLRNGLPIDIGISPLWFSANEGKDMEAHFSLTREDGDDLAFSIDLEFKVSAELRAFNYKRSLEHSKKVDSFLLDEIQSKSSLLVGFLREYKGS